MIMTRDSSLVAFFITTHIYSYPTELYVTYKMLHGYVNQHKLLLLCFGTTSDRQKVVTCFNINVTPQIKGGIVFSKCYPTTTIPILQNQL